MDMRRFIDWIHEPARAIVSQDTEEHPMARPPRPDPFKARSTLKTSGGEYTWYDLGALARQGIGRVPRLPFSIKVLLEAMLRNLDGFIVTADDVAGLANWNAKSPAKEEIPFMPGRVVLQDFTGVP